MSERACSRSASVVHCRGGAEFYCAGLNRKAAALSRSAAGVRRAGGKTGLERRRRGSCREADAMPAWNASLSVEPAASADEAPHDATQLTHSCLPAVWQHIPVFEHRNVQ